MTSADYVRKLDELDRLLNDPDVPIQPELIWCLLDEVMKWERRIDASISTGGPVPQSVSSHCTRSTPDRVARSRTSSVDHPGYGPR
jgi:hypothetical protein